MIRARGDSEVMASAAQIDEALAAGLSRAQMVALVAARDEWRTTGLLDHASADLLTALNSPAAQAWDEIFTRRARAAFGVSAAP